jgi:acylphosphatase
MYYKISVLGRVQGVCYRASIDMIARDMDLKGFVENLDDGSVLIIVKLSKDEKEGFIERLKFEDDSLIKVENIEIEKISKTEWNSYNIADFTVKYKKSI